MRAGDCRLLVWFGLQSAPMAHCAKLTGSSSSLLALGLVVLGCARPATDAPAQHAALEPSPTTPTPAPVTPPSGTLATAPYDGTTEPCPHGPSREGGQKYCSNQRGKVGNGYGYELWGQGKGTGCMTVFGADATFEANWTDVEDFLARVGLDFDETRGHRDVGNIWAQFSETQTGGERGLTYVGIYGWTVNPLREFYILDDWGATKPAGIASDGTPRDAVGVLEVDGATYDVWKKTRENKPSIKGTATFDQYFSIRREKRACGRISVSEHLAGWERFGLPLGNLYEVKLLVESQDNSGSVEFTSAVVAVD